MADSPEASPPSPDECAFDLERTLHGIVSLQTRIPEDAMTASVLGTERSGHGILIDDSGLIVTIGYLITEADSVWIIGNDGTAVAGHVVGYDQETGFGLVQALGALDLSPIKLGSSAALAVGEGVIVAGHGGIDNAIRARVVTKQEFAGYWEYLLDEAIFTAPAHPSWGGAGLLGNDGTLRGIGSLLVQESTASEQGGNMIVPIDLLQPVLDDLLRYGRSTRPARPWLGMMTTEVKGALVVVGLVEDGPADRAGVHTGDLVLEVAAEPVNELAMMFRQVWGLGEAGVDVPLKVLRNGEVHDFAVPSVNRYDCLKHPHLH